MTRTTSFLHTSLFSMTLIAGAALVGCVDSTEPTTGDVESALVSQAGTAPIASIGEVRMDDSGVAVASPGWTQTEPGLWTNSASPGANTIVTGAEGHARAIAKTESALATLRANDGSAQEIQQQEAYLASLQDAAARIATSSDITPRVTCNIGFVIGPSSPIIPGFIGAFAGAQLSCSVGTQVFTVQAQACTDFGCGPVS